MSMDDDNSQGSQPSDFIEREAAESAVPQMHIGSFHLRHRRRPIIRNDPLLSQSQNVMPLIRRQVERTSSSSDVSTSLLTQPRIKSDRYSYDRTTRRFRSASPPEQNCDEEKLQATKKHTAHPVLVQSRDRQSSPAHVDFAINTPSDNISSSSSLSSLCTSFAASSKVPTPFQFSPLGDQSGGSWFRQSSDDHSALSSTLNTRTSNDSRDLYFSNSLRIFLRQRNAVNSLDDKFGSELQALSQTAQRLTQENEGLRALAIEMSRQSSQSPSLRTQRSVSSSDDEGLVSSAMLNTI